MTEDRSQRSVVSRGIALSFVGALLLALSVPAEAQQPTKIPRIGFVAGAGDPSTPTAGFEAFRDGMRDLGYVEGKNISLQYRGAGGNLDRVPGLVAELVQLKVDVLVSPVSAAILATKQASKTLPIVMVALEDPLRPAWSIVSRAREEISQDSRDSTER